MLSIFLVNKNFSQYEGKSFFKKNLPHIFIYNKRKKETQNNTHAHENHFEIKWFSSTCQRESNFTLNAEPDVILHEMLQGSILF